jgi:proteasome lid subunit RPN8/RPN11
VGRRQGRVWYGKRVRPSTGERASVGFDGLWVLKREEERHDVLGFFHTHPDGPSSPSTRDVRTMRAWCIAFGKPLLCVIASPEALHGYRFDHDDSEGVELEFVELLPRGVVVGVERDQAGLTKDGRQVSS